MDWLERWFQARGGGRGRAEVVTPTTGSSTPTSGTAPHGPGTLAARPHPIGNVNEILDEAGGYKVPCKGLFAGTIEAAAMIGRLHSG